MKKRTLFIAALLLLVGSRLTSAAVVIQKFPPSSGGGGGGSVPTGTGVTHITAGVQDGAAAALDSTIVFGGGVIGRAGVTGDGTIPSGSNAFSLSNVPSGSTFPGFSHYTLSSTPSTPGAGFANCWFNSATVNFICIDSSAHTPHLVRTQTCGAATWVNAVNDDGTVGCTQPSYANLSGSVPAITSTTGDVVCSGTGAAACTIQANVVTNAKMATMGASTVKGSVAGGNPADLSQTQLTALLNAATGSLPGALSSALFTRISTASGVSGMAFGSNLTDASATVNPGTDKASGYLLPAATLSTNRTTTLGTTGSPPTGLTVTIFRYDLTAHTETVANGGTGGGTLCTFAVSPTNPQACTATFDGTNWGSPVFYYLGF